MSRLRRCEPYPSRCSLSSQFSLCFAWHNSGCFVGELLNLTSHRRNWSSRKLPWRLSTCSPLRQRSGCSYPTVLWILRLSRRCSRQLLDLVCSATLREGWEFFELVILFSLGGKAEGGAVAAALVIYRVIYFVLPLLVATALLAVFEARRSVGSSVLTRIERAESNLTPLFLAAMTFIIGAVLVASGGMPALTTRLQILQLHVPLWAIETSHLLASVAGLILLFSARGLVHRLDGAWWLALSIMLLSIPFSLIKGLAVVAPSATLILVVGLLMSRRQFNRRASLFAPLTIEWLTAIVFVVAAMAWILFFAFRDVQYVNELWWQFAFDATAPRALRAVFGVAMFSLVVGLWQLLRPASRDLHPPTLSDLDRARRITAQQPRADALLALMGDKSFLFSEFGRSFLMFSKWRRTWVALAILSVRPTNTQISYGGSSSLPTRTVVVLPSTKFPPRACRSTWMWVSMS